MTNALQTHLSHELSPLQQAALERIREFKQELAQHGIYMRSAIELEFMVADEKGTLTPCMIELPELDQHVDEHGAMVWQYDRQNKPLEYLTQHEGLANVEMFKRDSSSEYEVTVADMPDIRLAASPTQFAPEQVAGVTAYLKEHGLANLLQNTTCLSSHAQNSSHAYEPVFRALPYEDAFLPTEPYKKKTSALHVNVSLYDRDGNNLFARHPALMEHCCHALVALQKAGALAVMPHKNSLARIGNNELAPHNIGIIRDCFPRTNNSLSSIQKRADSVDFEHDTVRIENRLPGADADPYVAMATTMAALVDAVRQHSRREPDGSLHVDPMPTQKPQTHEIPKPHEKLIEQFKSSTHMRELLGDKLYRAILREYGNENAVRL